jgi:hypothetical protein
MGRTVTVARTRRATRGRGDRDTGTNAGHDRNRDGRTDARQDKRRYPPWNRTPSNRNHTLRATQDSHPGSVLLLPCVKPGVPQITVATGRPRTAAHVRKDGVSVLKYCVNVRLRYKSDATLESVVCIATLRCAQAPIHRCGAGSQGMTQFPGDPQERRRVTLEVGLYTLSGIPGLGTQWRFSRPKKVGGGRQLSVWYLEPTLSVHPRSPWRRR